jgi:hypothetical protein
LTIGKFGADLYDKQVDIPFHIPFEIGQFSDWFGSSHSILIQDVLQHEEIFPWVTDSCRFGDF